jgi:hypothetical protein
MCQATIQNKLYLYWITLGLSLWTFHYIYCAICLIFVVLNVFLRRLHNKTNTHFPQWHVSEFLWPATEPSIDFHFMLQTARRSWRVCLFDLHIFKQLNVVYVVFIWLINTIGFKIILTKLFICNETSFEQKGRAKAGYVYLFLVFLEE